ncbi:MAG: hypothetical protein NTY99_02290 [DPANN group archaeon]|nr:hypothetical protein [DPANN group archaeon]
MSTDWRHWFKKKEHHGYDAHKTKLGKVWHFLAHDESIWSFVADAILVIVVGKFILLPLLSLALGTSFPMVAVVSSSMDHHGSFDSWWEQNKNWYAEQNITKEQFLSFPNTNGFSAQIKGKAVFKIPLIGWVKVGFVELMAAFKR